MPPILYPRMSDTYPALAVGALILDKEGRILLVQSPMWKGQYIIPGGHVEFGETLEDALRREVKEETNIDLTTVEFLLFLECIYPEGLKEQRHFIFFDFLCRSDSINVLLNEEATNFLWVMPQETWSLPVEGYTRKVIKRYEELKKLQLGAADQIQTRKEGQ